MRHLRTGRALVVVAALGLVGCGGGGSKTSTAGAMQLDLTQMDYRFDPATLSVPAGEKVTVKVKDAGNFEHNFSVDAANVSKDVEKGQTATVTFTAPSQSVEFYCKYHRASFGMKGTLNVAGSAPATTTTGGSSSTPGY